MHRFAALAWILGVALISLSAEVSAHVEASHLAARAHGLDEAALFRLTWHDGVHADEIDEVAKKIANGTYDTATATVDIVEEAHHGNPEAWE